MENNQERELFCIARVVSQGLTLRLDIHEGQKVGGHVWWGLDWVERATSDYNDFKKGEEKEKYWNEVEFFSLWMTSALKGVTLQTTLTA